MFLKCWRWSSILEVDEVFNQMRHAEYTWFELHSYSYYFDQLLIIKNTCKIIRRSLEYCWIDNFDQSIFRFVCWYKEIRSMFTFSQNAAALALLLSHSKTNGIGFMIFALISCRSHRRKLTCTCLMRKDTPVYNAATQLLYLRYTKIMNKNRRDFHSVPTQSYWVAINPICLHADVIIPILCYLKNKV